MQNLTSILKAISSVKISGSKQPTRTAAELEATLADIDAERATARAALKKTADLRCDLLLRDGTDGDIAAAEAETDRLHLILERLDAAEPSICNQLRALSEVAADASIEALSKDYLERLDRFLPAMRSAISLYTELTEMRYRLDASGLGDRVNFPVPNSPFPLSIEHLEAFAQHASDQGNTKLGRKESLPVYPVTFIKSGNGYNAGETASFGADQAWSFINSSDAEWADRRNIAPVPTKRDVMKTAKAIKSAKK